MGLNEFKNSEKMTKKRISEEKRKQEERRQQDEKKRLEEKQRKEDLFRQEEMKRQEEKRKKEEEEQKKKEIIMERLKKEEEARQMEKQRKVEEQRRLEEHRIKQYEAFFNQMFNMQRKTGPEISQQQMAYAQQAYQAYQYQYLQQMQAYGLKVPDQDFQLMLMHAQQQEANWYQQQLGLDKIGDLDKIGGLRELEKLGLKGKQNASTTSSTQEQRAFIDRLQTERIQEQ